MLEYSNRQSPGDPSFWRVCDPMTNECHCDFRMTISDCVESEALKIVNIFDIVWSGAATVIAGVILYWRLFHRNQQILDCSSRIPRPKPIESMAVFGILFNVTRIIHATVLLTNVANNAIFRSFMFELPWQFGITALSCYLFGVANTLSNSSNTIYKSWVRSQTLVDTICITMITLPYITINPVAITAGYYAQSENNEQAIIWTDTIYYLWLIYTFLLGSLILFAGFRLLKLLNNHLLMQTDLRVNIAKIRTGAIKVKIIIGIGCFCLWAFTVGIALYATSRYAIMSNPIYTIALATFALFNGPFATSVVEFAVLLNPHMLRGLASLSFGSSTGSQSSPSVIALDSRQQPQQKELTNDERKYDITNMTTPAQLDQWNRFFTKDINNDTTLTNDHNKSDNYTSHNNLGYSLSSYPTSPSTTDIPFPASTYQKSIAPLHHHSNIGQISGSIGFQDTDSPTMSKVEEEQFYYNAMTNQMRMPPHYSSSDDRRFTDGNGSFTSEILDSSSISVTYLVDTPYTNKIH
ncbi:uncharacterized protein BX664DRAFT_327108 [Halteromyces radiatus]|uniref:uncharacterized protein n=1 Tax=Halteromyces radiatus TaxID=101107 RepID=UPI00221E913F|nr:uncharacterized protein BX664DRAFT_327108 [Halteromyces radiatus]KAI8097726.1 hypothetical protein BX664DRAFT_327108 [Halteromyces radiatus]